MRSKRDQQEPADDRGLESDDPARGPGLWVESSRVEHRGAIATVRVDTLREPDGTRVEREIVEHPGAVAIVAHDDHVVHLVRQPREAVGEPQLLELPAGKLDVPDEAPMECARRELREEAGVEAEHWRELRSVYTSPGFAEEVVHIFEATGLTDVGARPDPGERVAQIRWPLERLDELIASCRDAKSLIGLYELRDLLADEG